MTFGVRVENASGFTQIDETYTNYLIHSSGTASSGFLLDVAGSNPNYTMFIRPTDRTGVKQVRVAYFSGASRQIYFSTSADYLLCLNAADLAAPTTGYGFNVYNSAGDLAYSSEFPVARVNSLDVSYPQNGDRVTLKLGDISDDYVLAEPYTASFVGPASTSPGAPTITLGWFAVFDYNAGEIYAREDLYSFSGGTHWQQYGLRSQMAATVL